MSTGDGCQDASIETPVAEDHFMFKYKLRSLRNVHREIDIGPFPDPDVAIVHCNGVHGAEIGKFTIKPGGSPSDSYEMIEQEQLSLYQYSEGRRIALYKA
jgi:hypothetical protein